MKLMVQLLYALGFGASAVRDRAGYGLRERTHVCCPKRSGQAAVEYILAAGVLVTCVGVLAVLLYALRQHAGRVLLLIGSDYP